MGEIYLNLSSEPPERISADVNVAFDYIVIKEFNHKKKSANHTYYQCPSNDICKNCHEHGFVYLSFNTMIVKIFDNGK